MRHHAIAMLCGGLALFAPLAGVAADDAPTQVLPRSLTALAKVCEKKGGVRAAVFERALQSAERKRSGWVVALQATDTMVRLAHAKQLAEAVNKTVYPVAASSVVGAYIGETEKNLELLFERAERGGWLLFFDEADALFGKRSDVEDSEDRYTSEAASTLTSRLLGYPGIVVLGARSTTSLEPEEAKARVDAVVTTPAQQSELIPALSWKAVCKTPALRGEPKPTKA